MTPYSQPTSLRGYSAAFAAVQQPAVPAVKPPAPNQHRPYTMQENRYLRAHYITDTQADIMANLPGRRWTNIGNQASRLGCSGRTHVMPVKQISSWHEANLAILRTHYPTGGAVKVAALTGLTLHAVRAAASRNNIHYVAQGRGPRAHRPYRPRASKVAVVKVARTPRPLPPVKPPRISTPNVNAAMSRKRRAEPAAVITAQEISRLNYSHPARMAYTMGGITGWQQWKATQA